MTEQKESQQSEHERQRVPMDPCATRVIARQKRESAQEVKQRWGPTSAKRPLDANPFHEHDALG